MSDVYQSLDERRRQTMLAALSMLQWARAFFSQRAHLGHEVEVISQETAPFVLSKIGPLATCYRNCYREFCASLGLNSITDYTEAMTKFDQCMKYAESKGEKVIIYRYDPNAAENPNPCKDDCWVTPTPWDMHTDIMGAYNEFQQTFCKKGVKRGDEE